jgi:hypothetical protein
MISQCFAKNKYRENNKLKLNDHIENIFLIRMNKGIFTHSSYTFKIKKGFSL